MELRIPTTRELSLGGSSGRFTALGTDSRAGQAFPIRANTVPRIKDPFHAWRKK